MNDLFRGWRALAVVSLCLLAPTTAFADAVPIAQAPQVAAGNDHVSYAAPSTYLTNILRAFREAFKTAGQSAAAGGTALAIVFFSWAVSQTAAKMALRAALSQYIWQFAAAFAYALFALNATSVASWFADGLAGYASRAAGAEFSGAGGVLSNPSLLMTKAFSVTQILFTQGMQQPASDGLLDTAKAFGANALMAAERWPILLAGAFVVIGFWWTAVTGMAVVVYANAKVLIGASVSPFLILPITRPVGAAGLALIVSSAFELAIQSQVVGIGFGVLQGFSLDAQSDFQAVFETALGACAVAFICSGASAAVALAARAIKFF
jgi:hypothetical protein